MQAFLIDPFDQTVTAVEYSGNYQDIYKLIGASLFDVVRIRKGDSIYVDDEGLFREEQAFFKHKDYPNPLAGKALVLGTNDEGDSIEPNCVLAELKHNIEFGFPMNVMGRLVWVRQEN